MKVYYLSLDQLLPGMILADTIYLPDGTALLEKQAMISAKNITKMKLFRINKVPVFIPDSVSECIDKASVSHWNKVRSTPEFKKFQKNYQATSNFVRDEFQKLTDSDTREYDPNVLTEAAYSLTEESYSPTQVFDLLHCMRDYDDSTYMHCLNVSLICNSIGIWLDFNEEDLRQLTFAGMIHDVGKLLIPYELINKPTRLTDEEFEIIKQHPSYGASIMAPYDLDSRVRDAILMHHERMDGSGYPNHLVGNEITSFAKIVAIADVYDAMTALRTYRESISPFDVVAEFERNGYAKFETSYLLPFLTRIVQAYIGVPVLLSNSLVGEVVMINPQQLSRPIIKIGSDFIDLAKEKDIFIRALC